MLPCLLLSLSHELTQQFSANSAGAFVATTARCQYLPPTSAGALAAQAERSDSRDTARRHVPWQRGVGADVGCARGCRSAPSTSLGFVIARVGHPKQNRHVRKVPDMYRQILDPVAHSQLRQKYPGIIRLLWAGDWSAFSGPNFWVTVVAKPFPESAGALA
jgi:hypothetical protein